MTKMIGAAVVAALCFAAPPGAHAELTCGPMKFFKGESGRNPVAYTSIAINNGTQWYVGHHMQNGDVYYRQNQYNMGPLQRSYNVATSIGWGGDRQSNPDFHMNGLLWKQRSSSRPPSPWARRSPMPIPQRRISTPNRRPMAARSLTG
jgi:hypothetical protein